MESQIGMLLGLLFVGFVAGGVGALVFALVQPLLPKRSQDTTPENP